MKSIFTLLLFTLISIYSFSQDSISVLFIGNSYTYVNDLPSMTSSLAISLGDEITFDSKTNGGFSFASHQNDPLTHTKIQSKPWDYVVLQAQSQEPSFPTDQVNTQTLPYAIQLADSVYDNRYCSQAMFFMTWGREVGDPQWDSINTFYKMNDRLRSAYIRFSDSAEASVAPVGVAWRYVRDNHPTIQLYSGDGSHPSVAGSYLAACTFYSSLFRKSPVGASFISTLDANTASILQNAAALCVLDSVDFWHLRSNSEIAIANFETSLSDLTVDCTNTSWRYTDSYWDFGDGTFSTQTNPQHTYAFDGTYTISLIVLNECGDDTLQSTVTVQTAGLNESMEANAKIALIDKGVFEISEISVLSLQSIVLVDVTGKTVDSEVFNLDAANSILHVDLSGQADGLYLLLFVNSNNEQQIIRLKN